MTRWTPQNDAEVNNQDSKWRGLDCLIIAFAGGTIGETARHMVQYDQVPWSRVLILVVSALVGGFSRARTTYKFANKSRISKHATEWIQHDQ